MTVWQRQPKTLPLCQPSHPLPIPSPFVVTPSHSKARIEGSLKAHDDFYEYSRTQQWRSLRSEPAGRGYKGYKADAAVLLCFLAGSCLFFTLRNLRDDHS
ncbi:hypothetical protein E1B28_003407 [Marasmius oreades]|uniref:Uncharacterized protein n=1 Tax=Marasmius oreades TaxID=181124 RepID=A0A9P7RLI9_9AGAR|nr:uncharacterized protein E1B28_003407 [Marasmius oreades]KAG7085874.1 hypothetical protein E1B28_003407 [Marasmius oreades]